MNTTTKEAMPSSLLTVKGGQADILQSTTDTLMQQAATARANGDNETAARLLRAMASILGGDELDDMPASRGATRSGRPDGRRQTTPETEKIKAMLREGWREAHELQEATGLNANRVHSLLGRLKNSRELKFEKRVITQYRLVD
jgi:hypothetical protein